jgi:hypothetical protein
LSLSCNYLTNFRTICGLKIDHERSARRDFHTALTKLVLNVGSELTEFNDIITAGPMPVDMTGTVKSTA